MVAIRTTGVRETRRALREHQEALRREVRDEQREEAQTIATNVRTQSPVRTGQYRGAWRVTEIARGVRSFARTMVANLSPHAIFVEDRYGILSRETDRAGERIRVRLRKAVSRAERKARRYVGRR